MKTNDLVAYTPKDINGEIYKCEIGKIKRIDGDCAFVYFHSGETASKTPIEDLIEIENSAYIQPTMLGTGNTNEILYAGYYEDNGEYTVEVKKNMVENLIKKIFSADNVKII
jgi:hypothetical protein